MIAIALVPLAAVAVGLGMAWYVTHRTVKDEFNQD